MRNLVKLVSALALTATTYSASAEQFAYPTQTEARYTLDAFVGGGDQIYYNCDSVESSVKGMLKQLGAENIRVLCTGGIDQWSYPSPAFVTARFTAASMVKNNAQPRKASVQTVNLRDNGSCHMYLTTLEALSEVMDLEIVAGPNPCRAGSRIRNKFEVNVLAFD